MTDHMVFLLFRSIFDFSSDAKDMAWQYSVSTAIALFIQHSETYFVFGHVPGCSAIFIY